MMHDHLEYRSPIKLVSGMNFLTLPVPKDYDAEGAMRDYFQSCGYPLSENCSLEPSEAYRDEWIFESWPETIVSRKDISRLLDEEEETAPMDLDSPLFNELFSIFLKALEAKFLRLPLEIYPTKTLTPNIIRQTQKLAGQPVRVKKQTVL